MEDSKLSELVKQREDITNLLNKKIKKGDIWYLLGSKWFKQWKRYVGYDYWDTVDYGADTSHPGAIDNSNILVEESSEDLKEHLIEDLDYVLIPEDAWNLLYSKYGLEEGQDPIRRKVVEFGLFVKHCKVEIYLLEIKFCKVDEMESVYPRKFSKIDTVETLETEAKKIFNVPDDKEIRLWNKYSSNAIERLDNKDTTLNDAGISQGQFIIVEQPKPDGVWPIKTKRISKSSLSPIPSKDFQTTQINPGLCGLTNLGNTCFMNSALQCMSNASFLTQYFLDDKYWEELNTTNPLGMKGDIAKSYADLIKVMWSGKYSYTVPRTFKTVVGKFAPQFSGYQQQDCQELMAFLLDGLHEDLNRVKRKPYIEVKDANGRPDEEVAAETWDNYLKRNNSIIVDTFHGLLKSTLVCPDCSKVSVTFDPFCYLSLPLPTKKEKVMEIVFIPIDAESIPIQMILTVPKLGNVRDLCDAASRTLNMEMDSFLAVDVYNSRFHKLFRNEESLADITDKDDIFLYEIPEPDPDNPFLLLPVYLREKLTEFYGHPSTHLPKLFGYPFLIKIPDTGVTYSRLYDLIFLKIQRFLNIPNSRKELESSDEDTLDSKFEEDEENEDADQQASVKRRLFTIQSINSFGNVTMEKLKDDQNILNISFRTYLAIDWESKFKNKYYDDHKAREFEKHASLKQKNSPRSKHIHLKDCLDMFTNIERLGANDPWYCSTCKKHKQATKKFDLWSLPQTLIIQLKRFTYNRYLRDKIDVFIDFPFHGLDLSRYILNPNHESPVYHLIAVANHYGGMGGGHYTAYGKNHLNDKWFYFDDSNVSLADEKQVLSKSAYVLVYQKSNTRKKEMNDPITAVTTIS